MIPIGDDNPTLRTPRMTYVILGLVFAAWIFLQSAGLSAAVLAASVCNLGFLPAELLGTRPVGFEVPLGAGLVCAVDDRAMNWLTSVTSMFLHGGWSHLIGNTLFLWVFADDIEDSMGPGRFLVFYLICGLAALGAHVMVEPRSPVPTVGASGAISGLMGAFLVLYPRARVLVLFINPVFVPWFIRVVPVRAGIALLLWFGWQVLAGVAQLSPLRPDISGGVAVWAHIGGFVAGLLLIKVFAKPAVVTKVRAMIDARDAPGQGTAGDDFSQEQALAMKGDSAAAMALFEQRIAAAPDEPRVRMAAADFYMTHGKNPQRAADLYREVQRIPSLLSGNDVYVSNKLVDLYLGPLQQPGRALVELRRLIERYPDSNVAKQARMGLANLKEDMLRNHTSSP